MWLAFGTLESAVQSLSFVSAAIKNDEAIANCCSQKVYVIVSFLFITFETELECG